MAPKPAISTPHAGAVAALNSLTHGGTSKTLFLKEEDPDEFFSLLESAFEQHQPANPQDGSLVADTVLGRWFLVRRQRMCAAREASLHLAKPDPEAWSETELHQLNLFDRYRTQAERSLQRALNNVRHIHKDAQSEEKWRGQYQLQKERFNLQRERFELAKEREARLAAKQKGAAGESTTSEPAAAPQAEAVVASFLPDTNPAVTIAATAANSLQNPADSFSDWADTLIRFEKTLFLRLSLAKELSPDPTILPSSSSKSAGKGSRRLKIAAKRLEHS